MRKQQVAPTGQIRKFVPLDPIAAIRVDQCAKRNQDCRSVGSDQYGLNPLQVGFEGRCEAIVQVAGSLAQLLRGNLHIDQCLPKRSDARVDRPCLSEWDPSRFSG